MIRHVSRTVCASIATLALLSIGSPVRAGGYSIQNLGSFGGNSYTDQGGNINSFGQVTGASSITAGNGSTHAFLYNRTSMQDLGTLGGPTSYGYGINASGEVTGYASTPDGSTHAFLYNGTTMKDLGLLSGTYSGGAAINSLGEVTGTANIANGYERAFLYDGTSMRDLGTLGGADSWAYGINSSGEVTGKAVNANGSEHAFLYDGTSMRDLGTLGPTDGYESFGYGINSSGEVAGWNQMPNFHIHAFLYDGTTMRDLGTLPGLPNTRALGLNSAGDVVGYATTMESGGLEMGDAFIDVGGVMTDLNSFLLAGSTLHLQSATGINDAGQIVVNAYDSSSKTEGVYLLTPTPEPGTFAIIALGLVGLTFVCRSGRP